LTVATSTPSSVANRESLGADAMIFPISRSRFAQPSRRCPIPNATELSICEAIAERVAELFESRQDELRQAMKQTGLADGGWAFPDVAQFCYASAQRGARMLLERRGLLPRRKKHKNAAE
jgi:hypothetical protein